jgi:RimJ/RimL family protein N-acetyltransferase
MFYEQVILNEHPDHRYFSFVDNGRFVAFGGITWIEQENSIGEISMLVNPEYRGMKYGKASVEMLLDYAFNKMNLKTMCGECY